MGKIHTTILVDEYKKKLAKWKNINLSELVDRALNEALGLDNPNEDLKKIVLQKELEIKKKEIGDIEKQLKGG